MPKTPETPPPAQDIREAYLQLIQDIDLRVQTLALGRLARFHNCRPGCAECCISFSVLPLEAALLAEGLQRLPLLVDSREGRCIFLRHNLCSLYECRPIICRTQGMALAYINEEAESIEVSACPLNFPDDTDFDRDGLLFMDQFNARLAELNLRYCRQNGIAPDLRIALADLAACKGCSSSFRDA